PVPRGVERRGPPAQRPLGGVRREQGEDGQDEALNVPERVAVVAGPGQPLGADRRVADLRGGAVELEDVVAQRLLHLAVAVDLDVGPRPQLVEHTPLLGREPLPPAVAAGPYRGGCALDHGVGRGPAGPRVAEGLGQREGLAGGERRDDGGDDPVRTGPLDRVPPTSCWREAAMSIAVRRVRIASVSPVAEAWAARTANGSSSASATRGSSLCTSGGRAPTASSERRTRWAGPSTARTS